MYSNYLEKLRLQARYLDNGIEKLNETWKLPSVLVGRFGECTEETKSHIEAVWNTIKNTQVAMEETLSKMKESELKDSVSIEQLFQTTKEEYESIKEQCDSLETVLAEYGYHYDKVDTLEPTNGNTSKECNETVVRQMENLEVEFTPNLGWKYTNKAK
ncbi:uncharacterized protein LOC143184863 [Calliopsis andreniformis]|uniref:uncharacterized protein LOC143184863 n=1 Tax=Calliopsis andreniformis TaxID=337506 RepID=UPI003FCD8954